MPPIVGKKYCPLYKIDYLVTKKSFTDKVTRKSIHDEILALLQISKIRLWRLRRYQVGDPGGLTTVELIKLANYFNCSLDDLVVTDGASRPSPDTTSSQEEAGVGPMLQPE